MIVRCLVVLAIACITMAVSCDECFFFDQFLFPLTVEEEFPLYAPGESFDLVGLTPEWTTSDIMSDAPQQVGGLLATSVFRFPTDSSSLNASFDPETLTPAPDAFTVTAINGELLEAEEDSDIYYHRFLCETSGDCPFRQRLTARDTGVFLIAVRGISLSGNTNECNTVFPFIEFLTDTLPSIVTFDDRRFAPPPGSGRNPVGAALLQVTVRE